VRPRDLQPEAPAIAEPSTGLTMGQSAEKMAKENGITREEQDSIAYASHRVGEIADDLRRQIAAKQTEARNLRLLGEASVGGIPPEVVRREVGGDLDPAFVAPQLVVEFRIGVKDGERPPGPEMELTSGLERLAGTRVPPAAK